MSSSTRNSRCIQTTHTQDSSSPAWIQRVSSSILAMRARLNASQQSAKTLAPALNGRPSSRGSVSISAVRGHDLKPLSHCSDHCRNIGISAVRGKAATQSCEIAATEGLTLSRAPSRCEINEYHTSSLPAPQAVKRIRSEPLQPIEPSQNNPHESSRRQRSVSMFAEGAAQATPPTPLGPHAWPPPHLLHSSDDCVQRVPSAAHRIITHLPALQIVSTSSQSRPSYAPALPPATAPAGPAATPSQGDGAVRAGRRTPATAVAVSAASALPATVQAQFVYNLIVDGMAGHVLVDTRCDEAYDMEHAARSVDVEEALTFAGRHFVLMSETGEFMAREARFPLTKTIHFTFTHHHHPCHHVARRFSPPPPPSLSSLSLTHSLSLSLLLTPSRFLFSLSPLYN